MEINLTFTNIEEVIFYDRSIHNVLDDLSHIFSKWSFGTRSGISSIVKDALLEFMNVVTDDHLAKLSAHWGKAVRLNRLDSSLSKNKTVHKDVLLDELGGLDWNVSIGRTRETIHLSFWR